jgi:hypothetical protein
MNRKRTAVILCEDKQASTLLYQYLKHERRFKHVFVLPLPAGEGCGSQYVRERFPGELRKQRDKAVASVLVVHTDADNRTVAERKQELAAALAREEVAPRQPGEPVALVVPRWETENWLHHFLARPAVTESGRYPKFSGEEARAAKPTVAALVSLVDGSSAAPKNLPSIEESALELRRLP